MSLRDEDRQKNACTSRGLGIAAAAIGAGVGAALYYFFNRRTENPSSGGSTSQNWHNDSPMPMLWYVPDDRYHSDSSYLTISVNTTSDTSMYETDTGHSQSDTQFDYDSHRSISDVSDGHSDMSSLNNSLSSSDSYNTDTSFSYQTDSDMSEVDETTSFSTPTYEPPTNNYLNNIRDVISPILVRRENKKKRSSQAFRERPWTLEECSICFDVILHSQEVMSLPCTHHFHQACILPWIQEKQTCPNCRKPID